VTLSSSFRALARLWTDRCEQSKEEKGKESRLRERERRERRYEDREKREKIERQRETERDVTNL
jgi:hypothetical protein